MLTVCSDAEKDERCGRRAIANFGFYLQVSLANIAKGARFIPCVIKRARILQMRFTYRRQASS